MRHPRRRVVISGVIVCFEFFQRRLHSLNIWHSVVSSTTPAPYIPALKDSIARKGPKIWEPVDSQLLGFVENPSAGESSLSALGLGDTCSNYR